MTQHLGKRKRRGLGEDVYVTSMYNDRTDLRGTLNYKDQTGKTNMTPLSYVKLPHLAYPKSLYIGHEESLPISYESDVLNDLLVGRMPLRDKC